MGSRKNGSRHESSRHFQEYILAFQPQHLNFCHFKYSSIFGNVLVVKNWTRIWQRNQFCQNHSLQSFILCVICWKLFGDPTERRLWMLLPMGIAPKCLKVKLLSEEKLKQAKLGNPLKLSGWVIIVAMSVTLSQRTEWTSEKFLTNIGTLSTWRAPVGA